IETLRRGSEDMQARGSAILGDEVGEPKEVVTARHNHLVIVPITVQVRVSNGTVRWKGFLIAVSEDRGKTWTFVDGAGLVGEPGKEKEKLAQILPDFPSQLSLPAHEQPVLEPK